MSESRLEGTITLTFADTNSEDRDLFAVASGSIDMNADGNTIQNPTDRGWENSDPEMTDWMASLDFNIIKTDDTEIPHVSQSEIEAHALAGTAFDLTLVSPSGAEYDGSGFISSYRLGSGDQQVFRGGVTIRGTGKLTPSNPTT